MRACARVALASIAVSASFSLSGCAAIEELKETFLRWVESEKLPSGRGVSADELPVASQSAQMGMSVHAGGLHTSCHCHSP